MKTYLIYSVLLLLTLNFPAAQASSGLKERLERILKPYGAKAAFSLRDFEGNEVLALRGSENYAPASVAKTISTACSLWKLGPHYQFETIWGYRGKIVGTTLEGDLVVRGTGDPSIVTEHVMDMISRLRSLYGIETLQGQIIFDVSHLGVKQMNIGEGFEGDEGRSFATQITPLPFNQNSFSFWAAPQLSSNKGTRISLWPSDVLDLKIDNDVKRGSRTSVSVQYNPGKKQARLQGSVGGDGDLRGVYRAVPDTYDYYFKLIERTWLNAGGKWKNPKYKVETNSVEMKNLWTHTSKPLSQILMDVNKFSLNLAAELVLLRAGAEEFGWPMSQAKSQNFINKCLKNFNIQDGIKLTNASGLSRESRIQVSALTDFLWQFNAHPYAPEYLSSLSLLGADGTTKKRLQEYQGRGRLKTGTLRDTHTIAGFLYDEKHRPYTFALFFNDVRMGDGSLKDTEDQIIETLFKSDFQF